MRLLDLTDQRLQRKRDLTEGLELVLGHLLRLGRAESELGHVLVELLLCLLLRLLLLLAVLGSGSHFLWVHLLEGHVRQRELRAELDGDGVDMHRHNSGNSLGGRFLPKKLKINEANKIMRVDVKKCTAHFSFPLSQKMAIRSPVILCFLGSVETFMPNGSWTFLAGESTTSSVRRRSTTQFMRDLGN